MMNVRNTALRLLLEYEASGKYVNLSLSSHMTDGLSREERALLTSLLYTTVEHKLTYDYYIAAFTKKSADKLSDHTRAILRLGICQLVDMDRIPAHSAVNETVKLAKNPGERSLVNAVLRAVAKAEELPLPQREKNAARYLSVKYSIPLSTVKHFIRSLGEESAEELFISFNKTAPLTLTVNTTKISREDFIKKLEELGYTPTRAEFSDISVRLSKTVNPKEIPGFSEGEFFVQDEASSLAPQILSLDGGERFIDVCSAPGGKSFALAILKNDKAYIESCDIHESKLSLIRSGAERLGLSSVNVIARDAREERPELFGSFDGVLCDVPCSGLGVISKKPDLRYKDINDTELCALQLEILSASAKYLRTGGTLIYSTCTLNDAENTNIVKEFLSGNPDFSAEDFEIGALKSECGTLTLYPHIHKTDGFFIAKIRKIK